MPVATAFAEPAAWASGNRELSSLPGASSRALRGLASSASLGLPPRERPPPERPHANARAGQRAHGGAHVGNRWMAVARIVDAPGFLEFRARFLLRRARARARAKRVHHAALYRNPSRSFVRSNRSITSMPAARPHPRRGAFGAPAPAADDETSTPRSPRPNDARGSSIVMSRRRGIRCSARKCCARARSRSSRGERSRPIT